MSTICCMLHLFGKRFGQKGSTLYTGGFCACAAGEAARAPKQESAIATAQVLLHVVRIAIDDSSPASGVWQPGPALCSARLQAGMCLNLQCRPEGRRYKNISREPWRLLVRVRPGLSISILQDKFLRPFPGIHFAGIDVSLGIHGDRIDPMELSRHAAIVADRACQCALFTVMDPDFVVRAVCKQHIL